MIRKALIVLLLLGATQPSAASDVGLEVEVLRSGGGSIHEACLTVRGEGHLHTHKIMGERLGMMLPEGIYELTISKTGYYDVAVSNVKLETTDSDALLLRVMMVPKLHFERDVVVAGPHYTDAPLDVVFRPEAPAVVGRGARGVLAITNAGDEALVVPLDRELGGLPEHAWTLSISLEIEGLFAAYYGTFACNPPDCHSLAPRESVEIPVDLLSRRSYGNGKIEPAIWTDTGTFAATVNLYITHPGVTGKQRTRARAMAEFWLTIENEAGEPQ